jgi:hypothetical protein
MWFNYSSPAAPNSTNISYKEGYWKEGKKCPRGRQEGRRKKVA